MYKIMIFAAALAFCACGGNIQKVGTAGDTKTEQTVDMHNAENSLDYVGTYTGTTPAADCPGIEMKLTLGSDGTYTLDRTYLERDGSFTERGKYSVDGNLLTLNEEGVKFYYKVEENRLRMLDADKQEITGELASHFILNKQN